MQLIKKKKTEYANTIIVGKSGAHGVEGYNRLRDNILYLNADGKNKVIQIESSVASEGKTTVAVNLAINLGLTNKKVIILDLDFNRPRVHRAFNLEKECGIAEYVLGNIGKDKLIKKTEYKNVKVITRGAEVFNSSLVFVSEKFKSLIAELREGYDYVILDCAPVLQISDYIHVSKVSDGVLFLVAYGKTTKSQVTEAIKELKKSDVNILGSVFTMYDKKKDKNLGYHSYYQRYYVEDEEES